MATKALRPDVENEVQAEPPVTYMTSLQEVAETIRDDALAQARAKFPLRLRGLALADLLQRTDFSEYFKHGLAKSIANALAANDKQIAAIYYFDPSLNPDAETEQQLPVDPTVNLLVLVQAKSAALTSFIASLDRALTAHVAELPSPALASLPSTLNALLITEADVAARQGYAVLLTSIYAKPRQIW